MAIGTLAAIGIAGAVGGSLLGASSANKASKRAAQTAQNTADTNNALTRDIYEQNKQTLSPYVQSGIPASQALNSFLGLTPTQQPQQQQPNAMAQFAPSGQIYEGMDGAGMGYNGYQPEVTNPFNGTAPWNAQPAPPGYGAGTPGPMVNGADAFKTFLGNSDYGFQFQQGANALNSGYAGRGVVQSGAAMKGLEDYRQNLQQGYRGEFLNLLGNQQGAGAGAAAAQAGVATQMGNTISANNNSAGTAAANAQLSKQNGFANALSLGGGALFGLGK